MLHCHRRFVIPRSSSISSRTCPSALPWASVRSGLARIPLKHKVHGGQIGQLVSRDPAGVGQAEIGGHALGASLRDKAGENPPAAERCTPMLAWIPLSPLRA